MKYPSIIIRIDDRLIHGQILVGWCGHLHIKKFVISDDEIANNEWKKNFITLNAESDSDIEVLTAENTCQYITENINNEKITMILVRSPHQIKKMADIGLPLKIINVGGIHYREGRNEYLLYLFLDDEEVRLFKDLIKQGFVFECQDLPTNPKYNLEKILDKK